MEWGLAAVQAVKEFPSKGRTKREKFIEYTAREQRAGQQRRDCYEVVVTGL